jgi:pseudaminic acid biosynthesis-associated methylase
MITTTYKNIKGIKMHTRQDELWTSDFGKQYTDRNTYPSFEDFNRGYVEWYGVSRIAMNEAFIGFLDKENTKILEVGCNLGYQLQALQMMGFKQLYGVELQEYAAEKARKLQRNINIVQGSGFDLPFKDKFFDVTFTSGVLIHVAPENLLAFTKEIVRCSKKYIWGLEYYCETLKEVTYRGNKGYLWKMDYAKFYLDNFPNLRLLKKELLPIKVEQERGNVDCMFLLEKYN